MILSSKIIKNLNILFWKNILFIYSEKLFLKLIRILNRKNNKIIKINRWKKTEYIIKIK